jgi:hypothetical protein
MASRRGKAQDMAARSAMTLRAAGVSPRRRQRAQAREEGKTVRPEALEESNRRRQAVLQGGGAEKIHERRMRGP